MSPASAGTFFYVGSYRSSAAVSISNNIAEGFGRFGVKDAIKFYDISQSSAQEVRSMLYVLSDLGYTTEEQINEMRLKAEEARNLTLAFIKYQRSMLNKRTPTSTGPDQSQ